MKTKKNLKIKGKLPVNFRPKLNKQENGEENMHENSKRDKKIAAAEKRAAKEKDEE